MFLILENLLLIITNRNQQVSLKELVRHYESKSKICFNEDIFRALLSVYPDAYDVKLLGIEYFIFMHDVNSKVNPSKLKIRYDKLESYIDKIQEENSRYIDLVELDTQHHNEYKSAYDVIVSNIEHFSDEEEDDKKNIAILLVKIPSMTNS